MKDYFYGLSAGDAKQERATIRDRLMLWVCRAGVVIFVGVVIFGLAACATAAPEKEVVAQVCYLRPMGQTEEGYVVVLQACQSPEDYQADQK